jgi:hypothetical protein
LELVGASTKDILYSSTVFKLVCQKVSAFHFQRSIS